MRIYKQELKPVTSDCICDICNKSCIASIPGIELSLSGLLIESGCLEAYWRYGSKRDGDKVFYDLCEECVYKLVDYIENHLKKKD